MHSDKIWLQIWHVVMTMLIPWEGFFLSSAELKLSIIEISWSSIELKIVEYRVKLAEYRALVTQKP